MSQEFNNLCQRLKRLEEKPVILNIEGANSPEGPPESSVKLNLRIPSQRTIRFWSKGGINITAQIGSALVELEPRNILEANGNPNLNSVLPADKTSPALYIDLNDDNLYFWNIISMIWIAIASGSASKGPTGPQGPIGNTGAAGVGTLGNKGATGNTGITGTTGQTGNAGQAGAIGGQGPIGNTGITGIGQLGNTGNTGNMGLKGITGPQGTVLVSIGPTGGMGPQGETGPTGENCRDLLFFSITGVTGSNVGETGDIVRISYGNNTQASVRKVSKQDNYQDVISLSNFTSISTRTKYIIHPTDLSIAYVAGEFSGVQTFGSFEVISGGFTDIFVAKSVNNIYEWAISGGGRLIDSFNNIVADCDGNTYIVGAIESTAQFGSILVTAPVSFFGTPIIAKVSNTGIWEWVNVIEFFQSIDNNSQGTYPDIKVSCDNCVHVVGSTIADFDTIFSSSKTTSTIVINPTIFDTNFSLYLAKIGSDGIWKWASYVNKLFLDSSTVNPAFPVPQNFKISLDCFSNSYITGVYQGNLGFHDLTLGRYFNTFFFPVPQYALGLFGTPSLDALFPNRQFVAKADKNGIWQWAVKVDGISADTSNIPFINYNISTDEKGDAYLFSYFRSRLPNLVSATFGNIELKGSPENNTISPYIAKINSSGKWLWAKLLATSTFAIFDTSNDFNQISALLTNRCGDSYVVLNLGLPFFLPLGPLYIYFDNIKILLSERCTLLAKIDTNGRWKWVSQINGINSSIGSTFTYIDKNCLEDIYVRFIGNSSGSSITYGSITVTTGGFVNDFVMLYDEDIKYRPKGVLSNNVTANNEVNVCFLSGNIIDKFSGLTPGYNYYINSSSQITNCCQCYCDPCIGVSLSNNEIIGKCGCCCYK